MECLAKVLDMKVRVDFSVFISSLTESKAYGNIHGTLELPAVPFPGNGLSFLFSPRKKIPPKIGDFEWTLGIERVTFLVGQNQICLALQDVVVKTKSEAEAFTDYFVGGFDLYFDCFLDNDVESVD